MLFRRFDSKPSRGVPAYRRIVPFLMRGRNESAVYFEQTIDLSRTLPWIETYRSTHHTKITVFHVILASIARVLHERPKLNRFVSGRTLHDRDGVWISFAAKKRMDDQAPLSVVKRRFDERESFAAMVAALHGDVRVARSDEKSSVDKELSVLLKLPTLALDGAVRLLRGLDFLGVAPQSLLADDPMYTSVFVANLGSINVDAAYHHLYEYGNCPLFVTIGRVERAPVVTDDDELAVRSVVTLKFTYDERVEDGLYCARAIELLRGYVADPGSWLES